MLNESRRKWLTGYIGECWHEWTYIRGSVRQELWQCSKCGEACKGVASEDQKNRTFDTWPDFGVVVEVMRAKDEWDEFILWAYRFFSAEIRRARGGFRNQTVDEIDGPIELQFPGFLTHPSRLPELVCRWKEVE